MGWGNEKEREGGGGRERGNLQHLSDKRYRAGMFNGGSVKQLQLFSMNAPSMSPGFNLSVKDFRFEHTQKNILYKMHKHTHTHTHSLFSLPLGWQQQQHPSRTIVLSTLKSSSVLYSTLQCMTEQHNHRGTQSSIAPIGLKS